MTFVGFNFNCKQDQPLHGEAVRIVWIVGTYQAKELAAKGGAWFKKTIIGDNQVYDFFLVVTVFHCK